MLKNVLKRCMALLLVTLMICAILPEISLEAWAANAPLTGLSDSTIGLSYEDGDATKIVWSAELTSITGKITGTAESKPTCTSASATTSTLTIRNNKTKAATLSFKVSALSLNGGSVNIN